MIGRPRTGKHLVMLAEIREFIKIYKCAPTISDLMVRMGFTSTSSVAYHLGRLEAMGLIVRDANLSRGIVVCGMARHAKQKSSYTEVASKKAAGAKAALNERVNKKQNVTSGYYTSAVYKMPKGKTLEDRIEMVAKLVQQKEREGQDVNGKYALHNARPLFNSGRVRGSKVG